MKIFLDSANLMEIEECLERGLITGITTNPSLMSKEPKGNFVEHVKEIVSLCRKHQQIIPLSVEVFTKKPEQMFSQALDLVEKVSYENINIKVPIGWDELEVVYKLAKSDIKVNCTCLFTEGQCILAANSGATYVSIFMGRIKDIGADPTPVISNTRKVFEKAKIDTEIIVGSIRHGMDIVSSQLAGSHIVTAGIKIFREMTKHPQTTASVDGFLQDFSKWLE